MANYCNSLSQKIKIVTSLCHSICPTTKLYKTICYNNETMSSSLEMLTRKAGILEIPIVSQECKKKRNLYKFKVMHQLSDDEVYRRLES